MCIPSRVSCIGFLCTLCQCEQVFGHLLSGKEEEADKVEKKAGVRLACALFLL